MAMEGETLRIDPEELRDAARRFLDSECDRRAPWRNPPVDQAPALRAAMVDLGWTQLTLPEATGGLGQDFLALAPVYEEMGRALSPVCLAGAMATVDLCALTGGTGAQGLMAAIGAGAGVAWASCSTEISPDEAVASGVTAQTPAGMTADYLLVLKGEAVALVDLRGTGVSRSPCRLWDATRTAADIQLAKASCVLSASGEAAAVVRAHLELALACDSIGGARQSLEEAIAYMGTRQQFGRPIGAFQALKHRAADLKVTFEIARAMTQAACRTFAAREAGWACAATQARLLATEAYRAIAEEAVQFHGGIGFTWEHDCHLFLKRALFNELMAGLPEHGRDRIAPMLFARATGGQIKEG